MPFRDAQAALISAFSDHARPQHAVWQDKYRTGYWGAEIRRGPRSLLQGMEEVCAESAFVWRHLYPMSDDRVAVLILRCCPPTLPRLDRYAPAIEHPLFAVALAWLIERSSEPVGGARDHRMRRTVIRSALGGKLRVSELATRHGCDRCTVSRLNVAMKRWLRPLEDLAWKEITDRLEVAGLLVYGQEAA